MRIGLFFKLMVVSLCASLLAFALLPEATATMALKMMALGTVLSIGMTAAYPEIRGIKAGDTVSVVNDPALPSLIGRMGITVASGKKNEQIRITLNNGSEVTGVIESYVGLVSPPKIRLVYEEKLVE